MPYSFFTRLMAGLLMLGFAVGILWGDDDQVYRLDQFALMSAPLLLVMFVWSAVRDAAPFYDKAFHRTLPPGDGVAFWKVLRLPLALLGWVALLVTVYCWRHHFSWRTGSYGVVVLTVPMLAIMGVSGVLGSLTTSRITPEKRSLILVIAVPLVSWALLCWLRLDRDLRVWLGRDADPSGYSGWYYLSRWRLLALTGAVLGPLVWWLVAVKRRLLLGGAFAVAFVACLPWFGFYGDFFKWTQAAVPVPAEVNPLRLTRKPEPTTDAVGVPVGDLLTLEGLGKNEFAIFGRSFLCVREVRPGQSMRQSSTRYGDLTAGLSDAGEVVWGQSTIWETLCRKLPGSPALTEWWEPSLNQPRELQFLRPGKMAPNERSRFMSLGAAGQYEDLWRKAWKLDGQVFTFGPPYVFEVAKGGSAPLPSGGLMRVEPPHPVEHGFACSVIVYLEGHPGSDGPWLEPRRSPLLFDGGPWLILSDEATGQAYALRTPGWTGWGEGLLGLKYRWEVYAGDADTEKSRQRLELLKRCRLYVFWPEEKSSVEVEVPPPGQ